eukprot:6823806-Karenia_brevis.AAC.1
MTGSCVAGGRHGCKYSGMGQNNVAYGIDHCSYTSSISSDDDGFNDLAFPPSDDDEACAAFIKE